MVRQSRQLIFSVFYPSYAEDPLRHDVPLGVLFLNVASQRIFGLNRRCSWPVHFTSRLTYPDRVTAGSEAMLSIAVNGSMYIQGKNGVSIGERTILAAGVKVVSANHDGAKLHGHVDSPPIQIGNDCWLSTNSVVLPGVELGDGVVVAAGAVVTRSVPKSWTVGGVPAKRIGEQSSGADESY